MTALRYPPVLDPGFVPAEVWNRRYEKMVVSDPARTPVVVAVVRPDGTVFRHETQVLSHAGDNVALNTRFVERIVKTLLWIKGGSGIIIGGHEALAREIARRYMPEGERSFDCDLVARRMYLSSMSVSFMDSDKIPDRRPAVVPLGGHLDGCRIGFDLGGSDRKCAAVIDGTVVHSEEVAWNPYFESNPGYHFDGVMDSLRRAAAHMPRVDAVGGSAAGVYVEGEPRAGSLFRGVDEADFDDHVRPIFRNIQKEWNNIPFEVVNDGEVTALAASMSLGASAPLGIAMGTSLASGFCDSGGHISDQLNELAFVPVDYREDAPVDEWSGDHGCGVQYFSQQAVARLAPDAGIDLPGEMPLPERLIEVQSLMSRGDDRARKIYETIGVYLGYAIPWYSRWYDLQSLLVLGRVTSGVGGEIVLSKAAEVLAGEFPGHAARIRIVTPDEKFKRHGQAIAAASLPVLPTEGQ